MANLCWATDFTPQPLTIIHQSIRAIAGTFTASAGITQVTRADMELQTEDSNEVAVAEDWTDRSSQLGNVVRVRVPST